MKATLNTKELANFLKAASKIISKNSSLPILEDILIEVKGNEVILTISDLENTLKQTLQGINLEAGYICIPFSLLMQYVAGFKATTISIETYIETFMKDVRVNGKTVKEEIVNTFSNVSGFKILSHDAEDFVKLPQLDKPKQITFSPILFADFEIAKAFLSSDELRPAMTGIYVGVKDKCLNICTTDSHRLFKADLGQTDLEFEMIVNKKVASNLKAIFSSIGNLNENVIVNYTQQHVCFEQGNVKLYARLIEGRFPNYNAVIPKVAMQEDKENHIVKGYFATVNRTKLIEAIQKVKIAASRSTNQVRFEITDGQMKLICEDLDYSNYMETLIDCEVQTELENRNMEIGFNANFLLEILKAQLSPMVTLQLSAPNRAAVIQEFHRTFLAMPVMIINKVEETEYVVENVEEEVEEETED